jgi:hypothetical protein
MKKYKMLKNTCPIFSEKISNVEKQMADIFSTFNLPLIVLHTKQGFQKIPHPTFTNPQQELVVNPKIMTQ